MRATAIAVVCSAFVALGAAPGEPLRVRWTAHEGCPDLNGFWQEVVSRSPTLRRAQPGESAHEATVTITRKADQSIATFVLAGGAPRTVAAATCGEAVRALAVVTVIALDAGAQPAPSTSVSAPLPVAPTPASSVSAAPSASASVESAPPSPPRPLDRTPRPEAAEPLRASLGVGVGPFASGAVSTITTSVALDLERPRGAAPGSSLRLSLDRGESPFVDSAAGAGASFTWTTGRLDACFVPWSVDDRLALRVCAAWEAGALRATPRGVYAPTTPTRPWLAAYLVPRLQWSMTPAFALELEGAAGAPYTRDEFHFEPSVSVYRPAPWVVRARLGLLVRFP